VTEEQLTVTHTFVEPVKKEMKKKKMKKKKMKKKSVKKVNQEV
jgi:hypothetical protein